MNPSFPLAHRWKSTTRVEERSERKAEVRFPDWKEKTSLSGLWPAARLGSRDVSHQVHQGGTLHKLYAEPHILLLRVL